jgi:hypothetical protein
MKLANVRIQGIKDLYFFTRPDEIRNLIVDDWTVYIDGDKQTLVSILKELSNLRKRTKGTIGVCVLNTSLKEVAKFWCSSIYHLDYVDETHETIIETVFTQTATSREHAIVAHCINLDRRKDRWTLFEENFSLYKMPYVRFPAIEDRNGALGCGKSHLALLQAHVQDPYVLVVEDDAMILEPIKNLMKSFLDTNADVLLLGFNTKTFKPYNDVFFRVVDAYTTSCYLVKQKAIPVLIGSFEKSVRELERGMKNPIDLEWHKIQKQLIFVVPKKHVVVQRESFSDIEKKIVNYGV